MSTTLQPLYATNAAITITLASITNTSFQQSASVDNTLNKYTDAFIYGHVESGATAPTAGNTYNLYLAWTNDGGTTFSNNASGSNASFTPDSVNNLVSASNAVLTASANTTFFFKPFSFCQVAGLPCLPQKWVVIFQNASGQTTNATAGNHAITYQGINLQNN